MGWVQQGRRGLPPGVVVGQGCIGTRCMTRQRSWCCLGLQQGRDWSEVHHAVRPQAALLAYLVGRAESMLCPINPSQHLNLLGTMLVWVSLPSSLLSLLCRQGGSGSGNPVPPFRCFEVAVHTDTCRT